MEFGSGAGCHEDGLFEIAHGLELFAIGAFGFVHGRHGGQFFLDGPGRADEVYAAFEGALEQHVHGEQAVDFVGAFVDAVDAGIAVVAGSVALFREAHAAVYLHVFIHHIAERFRAGYFQQGTFDGVFFGGFELGISIGSAFGFEQFFHLLHVVGSAVFGAFAGENADDLLGDFVLDGPKVGDGPAKLDALFGVLNGFSDDVLGGAHAEYAQFEAAYIQGVEGNFMALADFAQQVFFGYFYVFKKDLTGRRTLDAQFFLLGAEGEAFRFALYDEAREFIAIHLGKDDVEVCKTGIGDPHLLAVEDVEPAVFRQIRTRLGSQGIGAGGGFREAVGSFQLGRNEAGQIFFLLLLRAKVEDGKHADARVSGKSYAPGAGGAEAVRNGCYHIGGQAHASVSLGHVSAYQAQLGSFTEQLYAQIKIAGLYGIGIRGNFCLDKVIGHAFDHAGLFVKVFGYKYLLRVGFLDQELTALDDLMDIGGIGHDGKFLVLANFR